MSVQSCVVTEIRWKLYLPSGYYHSFKQRELSPSVKITNFNITRFLTRKNVFGTGNVNIRNGK